MDILEPDLKLFKEKYDSGIKQVLFTSFAADVHTPISSLLKLEKEKYLFLFESVERGSQKGRYSVIGMKPDLIWECKNGISKVKKSSNHIIRKKINSDPLDNLKKIIEENKLKIPHNLPSIACGLFGYLGYEMIKYFENVEMIKKDKLDLPESIFIRPSLTLVFDNVNDKLYISKIISPNQKNALETFKLAELEVTNLIQKITKPLKKSNLNLHNLNSNVDIFKNVKSNTTYLEFKKMVEKAKKYIFEGEIFQVVLSRLFKTKIKSSPVSIYRALRHLNPSPYLFFMNFKDFSIVGSSPEILIKLEDDKVTIRPIAGTRKRGQTKQEDKKLERDLLSDPKEISEHLMLLDLGRNDISRVTQPGTVKVTSKMYIEYFSHVMHIVSNIEGKINKKKTSTDVLFSGFPAGTVTGAPKIRAIEIIEELEKNRRNIYAGSVGYISNNGNINTCIALRTAFIKEKQIYIQAGAGIVADSKPLNEFKETENKALAILTACKYADNLK
ncbi:MAG: anthranilate synthase component I [Rickettsiales bacterium]|nr:anthranilate synthase component I [Rickettsiales bacterium]|tara:strand:- start:1313 stop:2812 length:1500 start_codon:yes stop_codon:yes gene_type:complete